MRPLNACLLSVAILLVCISGCLSGVDEDTVHHDEMSRILDESIDSINEELMRVSLTTGENADQLARLGIDSPEALNFLKQSLKKFPYAHSSVVIRPDGIVIAAVPEQYADLADQDWGYQPEVERANTEQVRIVSDVFWLVEGFYGISQSNPIFAADGQYLGYTDITYRPEQMISRQINPILAGTPYDIWVAETGGRVIYDTTAEEIGRNLFSDPAYQEPGLQEAFRKIVSEPTGETAYTFWNRNWQQQVTKTALWGTAGVDGAEWRVVVTQTEGDEQRDTNGDPVLPRTEEEIDAMKAFVAKAAAYGREHGREAARAAFNDPEGDFVRGELYIFSYADDGTCLALPFQPGLIGENRLATADQNGVLYISEMTRKAATGGGAVYYIYPNPEHDFQNELKLSYVLPVDETWWVGSGIYLPSVRAEFNEADRDELVLRVHHAQDYAAEHGKEQALSDFNDREGEFGLGDAYIFAYGFDGTTLALPYQPELIGSKRLDFEDSYGVNAIEWEIEVARAGGGFVYVTYTSPATGIESLKLCYVVPAGADWLVGSGIYAGA